jgi:hypothetical protein
LTVGADGVELLVRCRLCGHRGHAEEESAITDFIEFPDRGHSLTIDHGWREVAQAVLDWLRQRSP